MGEGVPRWGCQFGGLCNSVAAHGSAGKMSATVVRVEACGSRFVGGDQAWVYFHDVQTSIFSRRPLI